MSAPVLIGALIGVAVYVLAAFAFGYYVRVALRSGLAAGLGWSFDRNQTPGRFRTQVGGALLFSVYFAMLALGSVIALTHLSPVP